MSLGWRFQLKKIIESKFGQNAIIHRRARMGSNDRIALRTFLFLFLMNPIRFSLNFSLNFSKCFFFAVLSKKLGVFSYSEEEFINNSCHSICEAILYFPMLNSVDELDAAVECT